jgi:23S rRNA (adenine2503-C2)-methyltransferase
MPITKTNPLDKLIAACHAYTKNTHRQIFFEYAMMKDMNDREEDLRLLIDFLKSNRLFYLNLIPLNPVQGGMVPSLDSTLNHFVKELEKNHLNFSVRRSFGQKVNAACGQLAVLNK